MMKLMTKKILNCMPFNYFNFLVSEKKIKKKNLNLGIQEMRR